MRRRASGEVFGMAIVGVALATAMGITVESSADLIYGGKVTVRDALGDYRGQISELIQVVDYSDSPVSVKIVNYGTAPVEIDQIRADSAATSYTMYEYGPQDTVQDITASGTIPAKKLVRIDVPGRADTVQILTSNANIIDIDLS